MVLGGVEVPHMADDIFSVQTVFPAHGLAHLGTEGETLTVDAVRQDQIRLLHGLHGLRILPADHNDLRVRSHHISAAARPDQAHSLRNCFFQREIIESHAHNVNSHRS